MAREAWIKLVNRAAKPNSTQYWQPTKDHRVCSAHFIEHAPTDQNPYPSQKLGYDCKRKLEILLPPTGKRRTRPPSKLADSSGITQIPKLSKTEPSQSGLGYSAQSNENTNGISDGSRSQTPASADLLLVRNVSKIEASQASLEYSAQSSKNTFDLGDGSRSQTPASTDLLSAQKEGSCLDLTPREHLSDQERRGMKISNAQTKLHSISHTRKEIKLLFKMTKFAPAT